MDVIRVYRCLEETVSHVNSAPVPRYDAVPLCPYLAFRRAPDRYYNLVNLEPLPDNPIRKSDNDFAGVSFSPSSIGPDCHRPFDILYNTCSLNMMISEDKFTAKQDIHKYIPHEY